MYAIKIEGLTKKYKDVVTVDDLHLAVRKGELLSLLGINGAGKTTTIKMLSCLTQPTSGDAYLNGKSICKNTAAVKSLIAVSPQETAVAPGLSVRENLELMCGIHGFPKDKRHMQLKRFFQFAQYMANQYTRRVTVAVEEGKYVMRVPGIATLVTGNISTYPPLASANHVAYLL